MTTVTFTQRGTDCMIRFPYHPDLVATVKATVPHYARTWNPGSKTWIVEAAYATALADEFRHLGHRVVGLETSRRREVHDDPSRWAHMLFKRVGRSRSDQVYRALSRCLHPDVGGDADLQRELNDARDHISRGIQ